MDLEKNICSDIKEYLSRERYLHTIRVKEEAVKLAKAYDLEQGDLKRVVLASLIHDIGKSEYIEDMLGSRSSDYDELMAKLESDNAIYHSEMSVELAKLLYSIDDIKILEAIRNHTTGKPNMNMVEKIVCLADYIEPGRKFDGVDEVRDMAYRDIDRALLKSFDNTIKNIIDRELALNEKTVKARNYLLAKVKNRGVKR